MPDCESQRELPFSRQQLFALAADVERYPDYLPGWSSVQILEQGEVALDALQRVSLGPFTWEFTSHAEFDAPEWIRVHSDDGPFGDLDIVWHFTAIPLGATRVALRMQCRMRSAPLELLVSPLFERHGQAVMEAFAQRAVSIYDADS